MTPIASYKNGPPINIDLLMSDPILDLFQENLISKQLQTLDWFDTDLTPQYQIALEGSVLFARRSATLAPQIEIDIADALSSGGNITGKVQEEVANALSQNMEVPKDIEGLLPRYRLDSIGNLSKKAASSIDFAQMRQSMHFEKESGEIHESQVLVTHSNYALQSFSQALAHPHADQQTYTWKGYLWLMVDEDIVLPCVVIDEVFGPNIEKRELWEERNQKLEKEAMDKVRNLAFPPPPTTGFELPNGLKVVYLKNYDDLEREGRELEHMVANWVHACAAGNSYIYSLRHLGNAVATFELNKELQLQHIVGFRGTPVDPKIVDTLESALEEVLERKRVGYLSTDGIHGERIGGSGL